MLDKNIQIITILGPTASGKTDLALALTAKYNGEIICADSRTIYRAMDIGTAKPSVEDQAKVPHHLLDLIDPGETLSAGAFKRLAEAKIVEISKRGHVPFLVGGSGLYIDAVIYDYQFPLAALPGLRDQLEMLSDNELRHKLAAEDEAQFVRIDTNNRRRLIRALETSGQILSKRDRQLPNVLTLGLRLNKEVMQQRIEKRIEKMLQQGLLNEVKTIGDTYGWDSEALSGTGYRAFRAVVNGSKTVAEGVSDNVHGDMMLVKKQMTWFRRNPDIHWLDKPSEADGLVRDFLGM
ncbi:tRNA (adenosine(37)-N6)-dimethylallyltransferase MiaA [Candidatus Saccharibacteria bacterium]|nr:tRNA (adenosine(37)-N6)-dimethylallyltransferase MiaA [Candidatus Saccharibacteria bacterium]